MAERTLRADEFNDPYTYSVVGSSPRQTVREREAGVGVGRGGTASAGVSVGMKIGGSVVGCPPHAERIKINPKRSVDKRYRVMLMLQKKIGPRL